MGLGIGVSDFEPALLLQEIAKWGLCVCMPVLYKGPLQPLGRGEGCARAPEEGSGQAMGRKGRSLLWSTE